MDVRQPERRTNKKFRKGGSSSDLSDHHFQVMNERAVEDIRLEFFYKPHTVTLLLCFISFALYTAFTSDDSHRDNNIWTGLKALVLVFSVISILAFPNGPFTRPHPALWRLVFGYSVFYLLFLQFALFQNFNDIKAALRWVDPERLNKPRLDDKIFFSHLLPNFQECWWDAIVLDVLLCNGLGIWFGMFICKKLEMREFHWESVKSIRGARGKIKRAVLQFTPASWTHVRWLDPECSYMRFIAVSIFVIVWQVTELNTFFLKHIFAIDTTHPIVTYRILLLGAVCAPTVRQYYVFVTDPKIKRMGTQCWVYCAIACSEAFICIKFGRQLFAQTQLLYIGIWLNILIFGCVICVYLSILFAKRPGVTREVQVNGEVMHKYLDSSVENISNLPDDFTFRRRRLVPSDSQSD